LLASFALHLEIAVASMQGKDAAGNVVIVGAGLAGLAAALGLHRYAGDAGLWLRPVSALCCNLYLTRNLSVPGAP
jgi:NADH dehydrogenase FAD-containing subunit